MARGINYKSMPEGKKEAPSSETTEAAPKPAAAKKPEGKEPDAGAADGRGDMHAKHAEARAAMHKGHEAERRDLHAQHKESHRMMHERHAKAIKAMEDAHDLELGGAGGAPAPGAAAQGEPAAQPSAPVPPDGAQ